MPCLLWRYALGCMYVSILLCARGNNASSRWLNVGRKAESPQSGGGGRGHNTLLLT